MYLARPGRPLDSQQDVTSRTSPRAGVPMKHHAFSPRAVAAGVAMAIVLAGGTTTGAMAAVTSTSAASARQATPPVPGAPMGLTATPGDGTATLSWSPPGSDGGS